MQSPKTPISHDLSISAADKGADIIEASSAILNAFTIPANTVAILATLLTSFNSLFNCLVSLFFLATRPWKSLRGGHVFCCACDNEVIPNETNRAKAKGINLSFILFTSLFIVSVIIASGDFSANLFSLL